MEQRKMIRRVLTRMLSVAFLVICIPIMSNTVKAATNYGVWVGNEEFTDEKTVINDKNGTGTATYDASTKTLTFDNFNGVKELYVDGSEKYQVYSGESIMITGLARLDDNESTCAIYSKSDCDIIFDTMADVEADSTGYTIYVGGNLIINGNLKSTTHANNSRDAINCDKNITINSDADVTATVIGTWGTAIYAGENIDIYGKVSATANGADSEAISCVSTGTITFKEECSVIASATGNNGVAIGGIYSGNVNIENSTIEAVGGKAAFHSGGGAVSVDWDSSMLIPENGDVSEDKKYIVDSGKNTATTVKFKYVKKYPLYVGKHRVTDENKDNIPGIVGGSAKYDPDKKTLTFEGNVTGVDESIYVDGGDQALIATNDDLVIEGTASLIDKEVEYGILLEMDGGTLTINGDITAKTKRRAISGYSSKTNVVINGKVDVESDVGSALSFSNITINPQAVIKSTGEIAGNYVTVDGGSIEINAKTNIAFWAYYTLTVNSGTINVTGTGEDGICCETFILNKGEITAKGAKYGLSNAGGTIQINGGTLDAEGGEYGIGSCKNYNMCAGSVTSKGKTKNGLDATNTVQIDGGELNVEGKECGLKCNIFTINAGNVSLKGEEYGLNARYVHVNGGTIDIEGNTKAHVSSNPTKLGKEVSVIEPEKYSEVSDEDGYWFECDDGNAAKKESFRGVDKYPVWIGKTQVTSENKDKIDTLTKDDYVTYDPESHTLTFVGDVKGVTGEHEYSAIYSECSLVIAGKAILDGSEYGILVKNGDLTITEDADISASSSKTYHAVEVDNSLYVKGTLLATTNNAHDAVFVRNGLLDVSGHLTAIKNNKSKSTTDCICVQNGSINVSGRVDATADNAHGIYAKGVIAISGTVNVDSTSIYGIKSDSSIGVTGTVNVSTKDGNAIYAKKDIVINGKNVTAKSAADDRYAMYSETGNIDILSGSLEAQANKIAVLAEIGKININEDMKISEPSGATISDDGKKIVNGKEDVDSVKIIPALKYTVSFDMQGHGSTPKTQTVIEGKKALIPEAPTETCYTFDGWYADKACTTEYNFKMPVNSDITLYANWSVAHTLISTPAKDATCTEDGNFEYWTCSICNKTFSDKEGKNEISSGIITIPAPGHKWGEWVMTKEPTDTEKGEYTRTCKNDESHIETKEIPEKTHVHSISEVPEVPATCAGDGVKAHYKCDGCDLVFADAAGTEVILDEQSLIIKGGHKGGTATCIHKAVCDVCHEEYGEVNPDNHAGETEIKGEKDATCTAEGFSGDVYCKDCGEIITKGTEIAAKGHTPAEVVKENEVKATCENSGSYDEVVKCSVCGDEISRKTVNIAATGHNWGEWVNVKKPTETEDGLEERVCNNDPTHKETRIVARLESKPVVNPGNTTVETPVTEPVVSTNPSDSATQVVITTTKDPVKGDEVKDEANNTTYTVTSTSDSSTVTYNTTNITNISSVTVPDEVTINNKKYRVTEIKANAFKNNKKLKKITIGKYIEKIGKNAFYGCRNLKTVTVKTTKLTKKSVGRNAFKGIHKKATVKVPKKKFKVYKTIFKKAGIKGKKQKIKR